MSPIKNHSVMKQIFTFFTTFLFFLSYSQTTLWYEHFSDSNTPNVVFEDLKVDSWKEGSGAYSINGISIVGSVSQMTKTLKQLVKVTDVIGREVDINTKSSTLLYIYDDGTVEKKYSIK